MTQSLLNAWERTLRRRSGDCAVVQAGGAGAGEWAREGGAVTFAGLDAGARRWLGALAPADRDGVRGRVVAFNAPNGIGWLEIFVALMRAGAIALPLDAGEPPAARRGLAEGARASFLWEGGRLVPLPGGRRFRDPNVCLIKLTSGTTGDPRPLVFTAAQMLADARQITATMGIGPGDRNYAVIPLGHSYGLGNLTLPLVAQGVPLVCASASLPQAIAADIGRWRPSVFPGVPALFRALAASETDRRALGSLRLVISAGAPLPAEVAHAFAARFARRIHAFYGSSETGGISFDRLGDAALAGGVGRPLRGVGVTALGGQRIRVRSGAVVTLGNRSRRGLDGIGCWTLPDRARVDADGGITLLGRRGPMIKIAGRRVNPAEVAERLRLLPGVREAWVTGTAGPAGSEPALGAVLATDQPVAEVRAQLTASLPTWKIPRKWVRVGEWPLTERGKPDIRALRALLGRPA